MKKYDPEIHHRRSVRLRGYDYSQAGLYFVTSCCDHMQCVFGDVADGKMILNDFGKIAWDEWEKTPSLRPQIMLHEFVIMPNHMHGIIEISNGELHSPNGVCRGELHSPNNTELHSPDNTELHSPNDTELHSPENNSPTNGTGECNSPLRNNGTGECNSPLRNNGMGECNSPLPRSPSQTVGAIMRGYKSAVTKQLKLLGFEQKLWQRSFHDHVIRDWESYQRISNYIINNPAKWQEDKFYKRNR